MAMKKITSRCCWW